MASYDKESIEPSLHDSRQDDFPFLGVSRILFREYFTWNHATALDTAFVMATYGHDWMRKQSSCSSK